MKYRLISRPENHPKSNQNAPQSGSILLSADRRNYAAAVT